MHFPGAQTYGSLDASGRPIPSRVQGERCIDFFVARGAQLHNVHNCVETLGDHYMIAGHVTTSACSSPPMWRAKPTTRCPKPETVTGAQWAQQQRAHWMQLCTPEDQGDTEAEWQWFNAQAEEAMRRAYRAASQVIPDPPQRRPKGSTFSRVGADTLGAQSRSGTSFRLRKWLKLQGRLREAQRQMIRADVGPHLWSNIRARWPSSLRPLVAVDTVDTALVLVAEAIEEHQAAKRLEAIHRWQQQLARRGKEAIRWLKGTSSRVAVVRRAEGASWHTAAHHAESLSMIKTYWSSIWNRQLVDPARAVEAWARHGHSARFQGELAALWTPVKLHQQACTMGASAAGPDGWSGDEIRTWPREAWNHFAVLLDRWVRRGSFPCAWQELRQIHIPKDEPELDDGSVDVQNMRPISVMSALWRCVSSCIAKDDRVRGRHILGHLACGYEKGMPLASLDYTKCFDHVNPSLVLAILQRAGFPKPLVLMLEHVWNQRRVLELNNFVGEIVQVTSSIPQGDGLSPMALNVLLSAASLRVFLDDRAFVAPPQLLHLLMLQWEEWSAVLGLGVIGAQCKNGARLLCVPEELFLNTLR
ncbi:unnamed protein product [Symbiodinium natans]|uniref:Reverse transcriptase domain-containing protein n=1 Tax=Symbiodinium natans TaxID=878477 RepID=A0A812UH10_9DINO|nr:unnamed protein product [Symbiodinium natans]